MANQCPKCRAENPDSVKFCGECGTPLTHGDSVTRTMETPVEKLTRGALFAGRYEIIEELGRGGMGRVFKVFDRKIREKVALKLIKPEIASDKKTIARFTDELKIARKIVHKNVGRMFDINEDEGVHYITMEYVEGQDLGGLIRQSGRLAVTTALSIAEQVCSGLAEAHALGVVHRDLKPSNIMIDGAGRARIMDFGIAKSAQSQGMTGEDKQIGTPAYMSPEQAQGLPVDGRTDIWALGIVLYEMLTGRQPFVGEDGRSALHAILTRSPAPVSNYRPDVTPELEGIIARALTKSVENRYQTTDEMLADIQALKQKLETGKIPAGVSSSSDLIKRRVPIIVGFYILAALGIMQVVKWLVNHYALSPVLPDFCIVLLLSLLPAVLIIGSFRARRGRGKWTRTEKIAVPLNFLISAGLLLVLFHGKDLGSTTKKVTYVDEQGRQIEQIVPKSEFRKKIALFYFDHARDDPDFDWLQYGIVKALEVDLAQDLYLSVQVDFNQELKNTGFEKGTNVPLALKKDLAQRRHLDYFLSGTYSENNGSFVVKTTLYETRRLRALEERTFTGENIFKLIDDLTVQIKRDMKIPAYHIEDTEDKPVSEVFTDSLKAFELSTKAYYEEYFNGELEPAKNFLEQAVAEDPSFSFGWTKLMMIYYQLNMGEKGQEAIRKAMDHDYKLSEKEKFVLKFNYFLMKQDRDMAFDLALRRVELFPDDVEAREDLAVAYRGSNQLDEAIAEYKTMLELDPERLQTLRDIASLYRARGEFDKALECLNRYADKSPDEARSFTAIGTLYAEQGDYEKAQTYYRQALLIDPGDVAVLLDLAGIESKQGIFDQAERRYREVLETAASAEDLAHTYTLLSHYYEERGQIDRALEAMLESEKEVKKYRPPLAILLNGLNFIEIYVEDGNVDLAQKRVEDIEGATPPFNRFASLAKLMFYLAVENAGELEKAIEDIEGFIESWGLGNLRSVVLHAQGKIHEWRNQYREAIEDYRNTVELDPSDFRAKASLGRCHRVLKEYDTAEKILLEGLKIEPMNPRMNYEMALVLWETGKKDKALEHLKTALRTWAEADPDYVPARKARETLAAWTE